MQEHEGIVFLGKRGNGDRRVSTQTDKDKRVASTNPKRAKRSSLQMDNELEMEWEQREREWERREREREDRESERERRVQRRMDKVLSAVEKMSEKVDNVIERFEDLQEEVRARPSADVPKSRSRAPKALRESASIAMRAGDVRVDLGLTSSEIPKKYQFLRNDVQVSNSLD